MYAATTVLSISTAKQVERASSMRESCMTRRVYRESMQKMALRHIFRAILETGGGGEGGSVNLIKQKRGGGKVGRGREREMCSAWRSFLPGGFCNNEEHTQVPYSTATRGRGKEGGGIMVHQGGGGGSIPLCCNSEKAIAGEKSRGGRGDRTKKGLCPFLLFLLFDLHDAGRRRRRRRRRRRSLSAGPSEEGGGSFHYGTSSPSPLA